MSGSVDRITSWKYCGAEIGLTICRSGGADTAGRDGGLETSVVPDSALSMIGDRVVGDGGEM